MAMKKVVSRTHTLVVKGELVPPGEAVELDAVEAQNKIDRGICEEYAPAKKKAGGDSPKGGKSEEK